MATDLEIIDSANQLARLFYRMQGYVVRDDYKFYAAHHPAEVLCWKMAVAAYEHIALTDVESALAEVE